MEKCCTSVSRRRVQDNSPRTCDSTGERGSDGILAHEQRFRAERCTEDLWRVWNQLRALGSGWTRVSRYENKCSNEARFPKGRAIRVPTLFSRKHGSKYADC